MSDKYINENTLIEDYPLMVLPKLAVSIGLENAIVIQQLYWLLKNPDNGKIVDGERWIFNTIAQWTENYFPFWSETTVKRIFRFLEKMGLVVSCQPEGKMSRRKYYRLSRAGVNLLKSGKILKPKRRSRWDQVDPFMGSSRSLPITETTDRDYSLKQTTEQDSAASLSIPAEWKPTSKEEQLAALAVPADFPSQREFDEFVEEECENIYTYREDLYLQLCRHKWHHWNERINKWKRIKSWKEYVRALDDHINP
jgi:DNA-binding PadR family transcriptional regulator